MPIDASTLLFFDASCIVAAAGSLGGGASLLLSACEHGLLRGAVSKLVMTEAEVNILAKCKPTAWNRYEHVILRLPVVTAEMQRDRDWNFTNRIGGGKDAHVLAAALSIRASYLITHDHRLAERVNEAELSILAMTPGEFIQLVRLQDPEYFSTLSATTDPH